MRRDNIGAYLVQESWLEGDDFDVDIGGYHVFRHNSYRGDEGRGHLFKGVAIILSPEYYDAWKAAGSPPPVTTDHDSEFVGRFISLTVKFKSYNSAGKPVPKKFIKLTLASVYHPCDDDAHERFNGELNSLLTKTPKNSDIIMGADVNARIGTRDRDEYKQTLGPHGITGRNTRGSNLLNIYTALTVCVQKTPFSNTTNTPHMYQKVMIVPQACMML